MNIGDVFLSLRGDGSKLQIDAQREGQKAGQTGGKAFGLTFKGAARAGFVGLGAVAGAAFGIAAKGAAELDAATRQFQADTGATAEEATKASQAIASMYRDNLQGFDQISAALSKVHTDLGLTGADAEKTAGLFLKFSTATGQDAASAVSSLDNVLDAWNKTGADANGVLDLLVASHQKYGGSLEENQQALAALAPGLQALGADLNDGVGLLNLFETAGVDSSKAVAALNKAVKGLKPGQTLDDLIKQISSIEDPTLRAQEAIRVFGAKGGVQLANALKPGVNSLREFVPAAEDIEGATKRASDAVESGFGNQFKLILKNAGGALAEFGNNFGPLLLVAGQFGPKMISAISGGLGAIAGKLFPGLIAKVLPGAIIAGTTSGTAMGAAAAVAEVATETTGVVAGQAAVGAAAAPAAAAAGTSIGSAMGAAAALALPIALTAAAAAAVAIVYANVRGDIEKQGKALLDQETDFFKVASLDELEKARRGVAGDLARAKKDVIGDALGLTGSHEIQAIVDKLDAEIAQRKVAAQGVDNSPEARQVRSDIKATADAAAVQHSITERQGATLDEIHFGLTDLQKQLHADLQTATETIKTSNDPTAVGGAIAAVIKSVLGGAGSADTTTSLIGDLKTQLQAAEAANNAPLAAQIKAAIAQLEPFAKGRQWQSEQLAKAQKVVDSNKTTAEKVAALKGIQQDLLAHQRTMAAGIIAKQIDTITAIKNIKLSAATGFALTGPYSTPPKLGSTPPKPAPARTPTYQGTHGGVVTRAHGGPLAAHQPAWVGERGMELFVPRVAGSIVPVSGGGSSGGMGGNTAPVTVNVQGLIRARDPFELTTQLRRLADFGVLTPRKEPA